MLYPLKFTPLVKERIWGARRLESLFGKELPLGVPVGESWELSGVEGDVSVVCEGALEGNALDELVEIYMGDLVGDEVYDHFGTEFPLLIKLIDAADNLSIQVHPGDELAAARHNAQGKTEMWYIVAHEPGASLYLGFKNTVTKEQYLAALAAGQLESLLNKYEVKKGDLFFIPAGAIHAIGRGLVVAEVQQTSDVTYRVYDFNRVDASGQARELHTEWALDALDFTGRNDYKQSKISCPYFAATTTKVSGSVVRDYALLDSFVVYICVEGSLTIRCDNDTTATIKAGETVLIPAMMDQVTLEGQGTVLESWVPVQ